jgi:hypothetical protein
MFIPFLRKSCKVGWATKLRGVAESVSLGKGISGPGPIDVHTAFIEGKRGRRLQPSTWQLIDILEQPVAVGVYQAPRLVMKIWP